MARPQNTKRRANEPSQHNPPAKRAKLGEKSNFSPEFWDNLSKVLLTPRALRELDRRNNAQPLPTFSVPQLYPARLARFARHGGPDLRHLRGYTECETVADDMSSSRSLPSRSRQTQSTNASSVVPGTKKSSAYGKDFQQHLTDYNIYRADHDYDHEAPEPANLAQMHQELANARASLSPSAFPEPAFRDFKQKNARATFERDVMRTVIPVISGNSAIHNQQDVRFTKLKPITNEHAVKPQPDFFDGARLGDLNRQMRNNQAIQSTGIPTKHPGVPVEPNFFLEVKGPDGNASVAQRQACYDGAYGARAMHALQNYGEAEVAYDSNAYTYTSTYHDGQLKLYAHHVTAPRMAEERPEYHMTQLRSFGMTDTRETFIAGATAFRNVRDSAERHRNNFIRAANARADLATAAVQEDLAEIHHDISGPLELHDSQDPTAYTAWQDADYALQQQIADGTDQQDDAEVATAVPREDSPKPSQEPALLVSDDPSMSFESSFTTFTTDTAQPKRPRDSSSPPSSSKRNHPSQGQTAPARRTTRSSRQAMVSGQSGSSNSHRVETYGRRGKVCFETPEGTEIKTELKEWTERTEDGTRRYYWQGVHSGLVFWATKLPKEANKTRRR
ncbi:hypothetical protein J3459_015773 [Metarhizium acridum]|uniref:uncharacterized protein n=1 Tax=Metarhizium acridum TaxID=92637 RepID=UPI001C6CE57B|nr:hypothetical protein J3459_015773 [Metarhizium acridum]KAG8421964.1 hypothetical protein J3458_003793 [Metarhizium acridum]KAG8421972.1 hypothetical protein J3458_003801 [Metarhizium acridum]